MFMNYIELKPDTPTRMHFTDYYRVEREIWDKELNRMKMVKTLVFWCDELDSRPEARTFSILSKDLAGKMEPFLADHEYRMRDFIITKSGHGLVTKYTVQVLPREEPKEL
jgi:hypothetical protein